MKKLAVMIVAIALSSICYKAAESRSRATDSVLIGVVPLKSAPVSLLWRSDVEVTSELTLNDRTDDSQSMKVLYDFDVVQKEYLGAGTGSDSGSVNYPEHFDNGRASIDEFVIDQDGSVYYSDGIRHIYCGHVINGKDLEIDRNLCELNGELQPTVIETPSGDYKRVPAVELTLSFY